MMRQRSQRAPSAAQSNSSGSDHHLHDSLAPSPTTGAPPSSGTAATPHASTARRRRQASSNADSPWENEQEEEDNFVGLSARKKGIESKRSWSSEDLVTMESNHQQEHHAYRHDSGTGPISPPRSGGLLVETASSGLSDLLQAPSLSGSSSHSLTIHKKNHGSNHNGSANDRLIQQASLSQQLQQQSMLSSLNHPLAPSAPPPSTSIQDFHVTYRNAHHVPDSRYRLYLSSQNGGGHRQTPPLLNKICCANVCLAFSSVAVIFLLMIGLLLDTQPLYIKGSLPLHMMPDQDTGKPITIYKIPDTPSFFSWSSDRLPLATSAYRAALAYFVCILACCYILYPNWIQAKYYRFRHRYQDVDDIHQQQQSKKHDLMNGSTNSNHNTGDRHSDASLPLYHNDHDDGSTGSTAYGPKRSVLWNHLVINGRQWLASRGWYKPGPKRKLPNKKTG